MVICLPSGPIWQSKEPAGPLKVELEKLLKVYYLKRGSNTLVGGLEYLVVPWKVGEVHTERMLNVPCEQFVEELEYRWKGLEYRRTYRWNGKEYRREKGGRREGEGRGLLGG